MPKDRSTGDPRSDLLDRAGRIPSDSVLIRQTQEIVMPVRESSEQEVENGNRLHAVAAYQSDAVGCQAVGRASANVLRDGPGILLHPETNMAK